MTVELRPPLSPQVAASLFRTHFNGMDDADGLEVLITGICLPLKGSPPASVIAVAFPGRAWWGYQRTVITGRLEEDLEAAWGRDDPNVAHRSAWPVWGGNGAESTSTVYFEIDSGKRIGAHIHDADETIVLLEGVGRGRIGDEEAGLSAGMVVHAPAEVVHDIINTGSETMQLIGFFSKPEVRSTYEDVLLPQGTKESGTPN